MLHNDFAADNNNVVKMENNRGDKTFNNLEFVTHQLESIIIIIVPISKSLEICDNFGIRRIQVELTAPLFWQEWLTT